MTDSKVRGLESIYTGADEFNALAFIVRRFIGEISTAIPVKVVAVEKGNGSVGYVDVLPLVTFVSGEGKAIQPVTLYHLPYSRVQGGVAALIIDPVVNDIGLAIFAHADSSNVVAGVTQPQVPASKRKHSQSDGFYIGGFLNQAPTCFLELTQNNTAILTATNGVTINGDITVNGKITSTGDMVANGISLNNHVHGGVETGGGSTSKPK